MKLRYFQVYDKNGQDGSANLQYWDEDKLEWMNVGFVRVSYKDETEALLDRYNTGE